MIKDCKNANGSPNATFFSVPRDTLRRLEWMTVCRRLNFGLATKEHVCQKHFNVSFYKY